MYPPEHTGRCDFYSGSFPENCSFHTGCYSGGDARAIPGAFDKPLRERAGRRRRTRRFYCSGGGALDHSYAGSARRVDGFDLTEAMSIMAIFTETTSKKLFCLGSTQARYHYPVLLFCADYSHDVWGS